MSAALALLLRVALCMFSPNSTWFVTSRISTRHVRRVERVETSVSSCAVRQARHSQNAWARHVERVVSRRNVTNQVEFGLNQAMKSTPRQTFLWNFCLNLFDTHLFLFFVRVSSYPDHDHPCEPITEVNSRLQHPQLRKSEATIIILNCFKARALQIRKKERTLFATNNIKQEKHNIKVSS